MGLFMHLACLVERLLEGKSVSNNADKSKIISVFEEDYEAIVKILKTLEKTFKVIIDDNEIATIIMIVKKI
jgi:transcriptional regulatory protein LevR